MYASVPTLFVVVADERDRAQLVAVAQDDAAVVVVDEQAELGRDRVGDLRDVVQPVELAGERLQHLQVRDRADVAHLGAGRRGALRRAVVVDDGLVLAARLRGHHRRLGAGDQLARVHRVLGALRDAHRDRDACRGLEVAVVQRLGEARSEHERVARVARRHDHAELLAADAADDVRAAHGVARDARDLDEHLVAGTVAVDVVDALEVVEVEHEDRDRVVRARGPRQLGAQPFVEVAVVVEAGQRVGLREVLEPRPDLRVVERERRRVAEPLRKLELVLDEAGVLTDAVDVERALQRAARDQRHGDQRLRLVRRSRQLDAARVEMRAVRPDRAAVLDRPAGDALAEARAAGHDLRLVGDRAREQRHELAARFVHLVDVQRLVRHQVGERHRDPVEKRVEALLGEHLVEDLGQAPVRLDETLEPVRTMRHRHPPFEGARRR